MKRTMLVMCAAVLACASIASAAAEAIDVGGPAVDLPDLAVPAVLKSPADAALLEAVEAGKFTMGYSDVDLSVSIAAPEVAARVDFARAGIRHACDHDALHELAAVHEVGAVPWRI